MRSIAGGVQLVALLILGGCSKAAETPREPVSEADYALGFCGHSVTLDADGRLWSESGCEDHSSGTNLVRNATAEEISQVRAALSSLPASNSAPCAPSQTFEPQRTLRYHAGANAVMVAPCAGDPPAALAAFDAAWTALDTLVPHPPEVDAATD